MIHFQQKNSPTRDVENNYVLGNKQLLQILSLMRVPARSKPSLPGINLGLRILI